LILLDFFMRSKNNQPTSAHGFSAFKPVSQMLSTKLSTDSVDRVPPCHQTLTPQNLKLKSKY
jgi:hypothetical protein